MALFEEPTVEQMQEYLATLVGKRVQSAGVDRSGIVTIVLDDGTELWCDPYHFSALNAAGQTVVEW